MNLAEKKLDKFIQNNYPNLLNDTTPSLMIRAYHKGRLKLDCQWGDHYKYYDLASLTKILFTVPVSMLLVSNNQFSLNDPVNKILKNYKKSNLKVKSLLTHTSGLPWWKPYYESIDPTGSLDKRWEQLRPLLYKSKIVKSEKSVYSDPDFLFLGFIFMEILQRNLLEVWGWYAEQLPFSKLSLHFNLLNRLKFKKSSYAPTEKCPWRNKVLIGEVHDDNCWSLGGVSTHAGLFGSMDDLSSMALLMRSSYLNEKNGFKISPDMFMRWTKRSILKSQGDWGIGFMKPTKGNASCGKYFSSTSFGHTGFTGTSLWIDPKNDLIVNILSNRVHPSRENNNFVKLRPILHNAIFESILHR